jgi:glycosyltransferase involved in cell wall biosynthesis
METANSNSPPPECDVTFFLPCYNEEGNIVSAINTVLTAVSQIGCSYDIVVVDDASKDNSVKMVLAYMAEHPEIPIKLLVNERNQGFGMNYAEGAFHGRGKYYRVVCGDDEERIESLVSALKNLGRADIVTTYLDDDSARYISRRIISATYTKLVNLISGYRLHYYNGSPIIPRKLVLRWHSHSHGFGFQADVLCRLLDMGASIMEVPVVARRRVTGASNAINFRNIASVGHTILELICRRVARILYPHYVRTIAADPAEVATSAFEASASGAESAVNAVAQTASPTESN